VYNSSKVPQQEPLVHPDGRISASTRANVSTLDDTKLSWRPASERRLLWLLDQ
jgi:hypothetical protein